MLKAILSLAFLALMFGSVVSQNASPNIQLCGMTTELRQAILDQHNLLRLRVAEGKETIGNQPGATDMSILSYSMELEVRASTWVSTCPTGHNPTQKNDKGAYVGENIWYSWNSAQSTKLEATSGVKAPQAWYDEVKDFKPSDIKPFVFGEKTGHYTQVIWAKTTQVGCGIAYCKDTRDSFKAYPWETIIVCNYLEAGNMQGGTLYTTGTSSCSNSNTAYKALCGTQTATPTAAGSCGKFAVTKPADTTTKPSTGTTTPATPATPSKPTTSTASKPTTPAPAKWQSVAVAAWVKKNSKSDVYKLIETMGTKLVKGKTTSKLTFSIFALYTKSTTDIKAVVQFTNTAKKLTYQAVITVTLSNKKWTAKGVLLAKVQTKAQLDTQVQSGKI